MVWEKQKPNILCYILCIFPLTLLALQHNPEEENAKKSVRRDSLNKIVIEINNYPYKSIINAQV